MTLPPPLAWMVHTVEIGGVDYEVAAWDSGRSMLGRVHPSSRHLVNPEAEWKTLCGVRIGRPSRRLAPTDYWTDKDCERCMSIATKQNYTARVSLVKP